jgi:1-acyl-sn-glycerol-3-phosphate acyltransferase
MPVLFPIRLVLFIGILIVVFPLFFLSEVGTDPRKPLSKPRQYIAHFATILCLRVILFLCGFGHIREINKHNFCRQAPLVVSNHVAGMDIFVAMYCLSPVSFVAKADVANIPFIGYYARAVRCLFVDRTSDQRASVSVRINERIESNAALTLGAANRAARSSAARGSRSKAAQAFSAGATEATCWPRICLFPEGTTTNTGCVIKFKTGAFRPGAPVQPMVIRYKFRHFHPSDAEIPTYQLVFLAMCQFVNRVEVEYLPVYNPSPAERADPVLFASHVRAEMAHAMRVPMRDFTWPDKIRWIGKLSFSHGGISEQWRRDFGRAVKPGVADPDHGTLTPPGLPTPPAWLTSPMSSRRPSSGALSALAPTADLAGDASSAAGRNSPLATSSRHKPTSSTGSHNISLSGNSSATLPAYQACPTPAWADVASCMSQRSSLSPEDSAIASSLLHATSAGLLVEGGVTRVPISAYSGADES